MSVITNFCILRDHKITSAQNTQQITSESIDDFLHKVYNTLNPSYPKFYKMDPQSKLGFLASEIVLKECLASKKNASDSIAIILSNATASLDTDIRFEKSMSTMASPSLFVYTLPNIVIGEICIRHGITGENTFFITDSFDAQLMVDYVDLVMQQNHVHACLAGWINVLGEYYDVFLYLVEKQKTGLGIEHHPEELKKIYNQSYGTTYGHS